MSSVNIRHRVFCLDYKILLNIKCVHTLYLLMFACLIICFIKLSFINYYFWIKFCIARLIYKCKNTLKVHLLRTNSLIILILFILTKKTARINHSIYSLLDLKKARENYLRNKGYDSYLSGRSITT